MACKINKTGWHKSPLVWREGTTECISVVFTWDLPKVKAMIQQKKIGVERCVVGGPAVKMLPDYFDGLPVEIQDDYPGVLQKYNPLATRTSEGCPNNCGFCVVGKIHPDFQEIENFPVAPVVCDDNFLACSRKHFDRVIDKLKKLDWIDFNQGLDASLLDPFQSQHASYRLNRLAELKNPIIRLAWDDTDEWAKIEKAIFGIRKAGIPRRNIRCYVLIGYDDTPSDALYRLENLYYLYGIKPNPMRYQPFTGIHRLTKNSYVHPNWTHEQLDRFMSYWANLRFTGGVPFNEYVHHKKPENKRQLVLV